MLKKVVSILLLCLYAFASSGASVKMHYCGAHLSSVSVEMNNRVGDCCCGKKMHTLRKRCCSEKVIRPQISQDRQLTSIDYGKYFVLHVAAIATPYSYTNTFLVAQENDIVFYTNAPPGSWRTIPLYKLHCRFTYYG
ncbi:hypothetical protein A9P82_04255 [Arachidicoccus ginsenosidimutans]|nr:hypothetical protein A9P82_04255 [Arachidicoccus sp. BS20]